MRPIFCLIISAAISLSSYAQRSEIFDDAQAYVEEIYPENGTELIDPSVVQENPAYSDEPSELQYYEAPEGLVDAGYAALSEGEGNSAVYDTVVNGEVYIDPELDDILDGAKEYVDDLDGHVDDIGITGAYGDCEEEEVLGETTGTYGCHVSFTGAPIEAICSRGYETPEGSYSQTSGSCLSFENDGGCVQLDAVCTLGPASNPDQTPGPAFDIYVDYYPDLVAEWAADYPTMTKFEFGQLHWNLFGQDEQRYLPDGSDCWSEEVNFVCENPEGVNTCSVPSPECVLTNTECIAVAEDGSCLAEQYTYDCPIEEVVVGTLASCDADSYCIAGDCFESLEAEPDEDFGQVAGAFAGLMEASQDFDPDNLRIFTGDNLACGVAIFGSFNCCNDEGLLNDVGLNDCNAEEQQLAAEREEGLCTQIGTYCSDETFFGTCLKKKRVFCCYGSKISRMISEQGNEQLGRDTGTAENPNCEGFTVAEFQSLDFGAMDLSEMYEDLEGKVADADLAARLLEMQQQVIDYDPNG